MIVGKLSIGQLPNGLRDSTHRAHVLAAVLEQVEQILLGVLKRRNAALPNQLCAAMILPHSSAREPPSVLEAARHTVRPRLCCGAVKLLKLRFRHVKVRADDIPEDQTLKCRVVGADGVHILDGILDRLRKRLVRRPELDLTVVQRPRHAEHLRAGVLRVGVRAVTDEVALGASFKIKPDGHKSKRGPKPPPSTRLGYAVRRRRRGASPSLASGASSSWTPSAASPSIEVQSTTSNTGV